MDVQRISLDRLDPPVVMERATLDTEAWAEFVADVQKRGFLQPLIVRPISGRYRVAAGYRRYRAAQQAGLLEVPCVVRPMTDEEELTVRFRENAHRENPNPVEEGALFAAMQEGLGLTTAAIAERVDKSYGYVAGRLELVRGPENVRAAVQEGGLSYSAAQELLRCEHPEDRDTLLYHAKRGGCTQALMRAWVQEATVKRAALPAGADPRQAVVSAEAPPILQGICEWHERPVPLDGLLSFRVCTTCHQALTALREDMKRQDAAVPSEVPHVPGPASD